MNKLHVAQLAHDMMKAHPQLDYLMCETMILLGEDKVKEIYESTRNLKNDPPEQQNHILKSVTVE